MRQYDLSYVTNGAVTSFSYNTNEGKFAMWLIYDFASDSSGMVLTKDLDKVLNLLKRKGYTVRKSVKLNP